MSVANIALMSIAEIFGDFKYKAFARTGGAGNFAAGSAGYIVVIYLLIKSLREGNVMYVNGMWDGISCLLEATAAYLILGERLNTPKQYIGLGFIIVGLFILHSGGISK